VFLQEKPMYHYAFYWYTAAACGNQIPKTKSNTLTWWEITLIALFSTLIISFLVGTVINKFYLKKQGLEIIPGYVTTSNMFSSFKRSKYNTIEEI
jgi:uncharacterized membrane protein YraQ (UPF0718 family)